MDMIEFTRSETGLTDEYDKVLRSVTTLIQANGRTREALRTCNNDFKKRKEDTLRHIQTVMTEISLEERAFAEVSSRWNDKKYWGEEE